MKYLAFILAFMIPSLAAAEGTFFFDKNLTLEDLRELEVRVELQDHATGACWTNLKEVREYAEEKFRSKGIKTRDTEIMDTGPKNTGLELQLPQNVCLMTTVDCALFQLIEFSRRSYPNNHVFVDFGQYRGMSALNQTILTNGLLALESVFS